ncbi:MAG: CDP-alcohol phosphatidyltransferase family protein [Phycisphaerales bacterium]|nr:CDP-alcohol phosphatidyltransferase family protein [Phycisphaerales bacterium]
MLPTLCTLGNLLAGFAAIFYAAKPADAVAPFHWSSLTFAGALIFVGMFFDAVDGSVARLTRSTSDLGAQLDSLCDLVTFGVAPAFMMLTLVGKYLTVESGLVVIGPEADLALGKIVWGIAAVYVCCAALRLARFNVETESADLTAHEWFSGLPSPGAAGAVASLIILHQHRLVANPMIDELPVSFVRGAALGIPLITLLCAWGMVSTMRYTHVVNRYLRRPHSFGFAVRLLMPLILAIWWFQETVAIVFTLYALSGPVGAAWRRRRLRRDHAAAPAAATETPAE